MSPDPSPCQTPAWFKPVVDVLHTVIVRPLATLWHGLRIAGLTLKPARFSLIMVAAGMAFLFLSDQGLDTLRDFAERKAGTRHDTSQTLFFFLGAFLWVFGSWYWARVLTYIQFGDNPPTHRLVQLAQEWVPRAIGLIAILGLAAAFYQAAAPYPGDPDSPGRILKRYALYSLIGALAFLLFVTTRRALSASLSGALARSPRSAWIGDYFAAVRTTEQSRQEFGSQSACEVLRYSWPLLTFTLVGAVVLFVFFAVSPEGFAPPVGSTPILLLAAAGWIAFGSAADLFGMRFRFPVFITLFLLAVVFSLWNDNHAVRTLADGSKPDRWEQRPMVEHALREWQKRQLLRPHPSGTGTYPLFVVAAEGGGIRAAYWTATVLGEIQDRHPCFADQLFALSGVSGGSLGAAVFTALLAEKHYARPNFRCGGAPVPVQATAQAVLGEDFLAPAIAATLYPDLFQRVLPVPIAHFDRARALESAWERAWQRHTGSRRFAQPFDQLWRDQQDYWLPALLLNSTWVETGKRLIVSNLRLAPLHARETTEFADVEDVHRFYDNRALSLSTAVHLSARFTYVSPAGTLEKDGKVHGRAVDGGYFENSGATTVLEILKTLDQLRGGQGGFWDRVEPVVILISNEPADPRYLDTGLDPDPAGTPTAPDACCHEVWSPLQSLLATRNARGVYARETTRWHVGGSNFLHFGLCKGDGARIPLGWTLSRMVRTEMHEQLTTDGCPVFDNKRHLDTITARLNKRFPGTVPVSRTP